MDLKQVSKRKTSTTVNKTFNRDLSWLRFNHRVLQEAADRRNPLYERIRFLAIFSSNLDEFFRVRVSDIRKIKEVKKDLRKKLISKPNKLLKEIVIQVDIQQNEFGSILQSQIIPELRNQGIELRDYQNIEQWMDPAKADIYYKDIVQKLEITIQDQASDKPIFMENEQLYLVGYTVNDELVWVKLPKDLHRFVVLPSVEDLFSVCFIDDVLRYKLSKIHQADFYAIKVSRDAELYIDNEYSGNLLDKIKKAIPERALGHVTRVLIDQSMPEILLNKIKETMELHNEDIIKGGKYHNLKDFFQFPDPDGSARRFTPLAPIYQRDLPAYNSVFDAVLKKDRMFYFPYESFDPIVRFVDEAAEDPRVTKINATLYRVSKNSVIAKSLLKAAENGKEVLVFIETKARFDEENNIYWGNKLEQSGAAIRYSYPGIKVHSKILYVERENEGETESVCYIGTGNFNENTARIYTDLGLLTAQQKITKEVLQVFHVLERKIIIPKTKKLLVSPFTTRRRFMELVENEIENAQKGKKAYIILKLNSLQDYRMIKQLYRASEAGVKIRLLVRGICCLVPGIPGQSENISVISIVDRFLEHARIYIFANGGREKVYIGSADWMTRNLDHRIEVVTPVIDSSCVAKIKRIIDLQLKDSVKARIIDKDQSNRYVPNTGETKSSQHLIYEALNHESI